MSEDGRELVAAQTGWRETWATEWTFGFTQYPRYDFTRTVTDCSLHFRDARTTASVHVVATPDRCGEMPGGFSPSITRHNDGF
jgi:hypothetical protein